MFKNKAGSYIFESAFILPMVFVAMIALLSIIPIITSCEKSIYVACDEMRISSIRQATAKYDVSFKGRVKDRVKKEDKNIDYFTINTFQQRTRRFGRNDIMYFDYNIRFDTANPIGIVEKVDFNGRVMARAFTGNDNKGESLSDEEFMRNCESEKVCIFPKTGKKYHKKNCKYIKPACKSFCLTNKIKSRWNPCNICKSQNAQVGSAVFCFPNSGKVYHISKCSTIKKYYIEIEKFYAEKKGYKPCHSCGYS